MATTTSSLIEHPGSYIKEEMEARGWTQQDLAFALGCSEQALHAILSGTCRISISADLAKALGEAFDVPAEFFANLQQAYEEATTEMACFTKADDIFRNMGICYMGRGSLGWVSGGGHCRYLPHWMQTSIVATWNHIVCLVRGHNRILRDIREAVSDDGSYHCVDCCKRLRD